MMKRTFLFLCLVFLAVPAMAGGFNGLGELKVEIDFNGPGATEVVEGIRSVVGQVDGARVVSSGGTLRMYVTSAGDQESYAVSVVGVEFIDVAAVLLLKKDILTPASAEVVATLLQDRGKLRDSLVYRARPGGLQGIGRDAALHVLKRLAEERQKMLKEIDEALKPST